MKFYKSKSQWHLFTFGKLFWGFAWSSDYSWYLETNKGIKRTELFSIALEKNKGFPQAFSIFCGPIALLFIWMSERYIDGEYDYELADYHKGTCARCGKFNPLKIEDCPLGAEIVGAGTEPHIFKK